MYNVISIVVNLFHAAPEMSSDRFSVRRGGRTLLSSVGRWVACGKQSECLKRVEQLSDQGGQDQVHSLRALHTASSLTHNALW